ncbi:HEAT repeat domain-containing protein [Massilia putida]|uniref:HEAT repeat domain-containing protein n=1 Tax=Massilia putida TaxID=1141883 RepID=UPI000951CBF9|nr:HEAT repeat domain-containing protein [Massilia putida]
MPARRQRGRAPRRRPGAGERTGRVPGLLAALDAETDLAARSAILGTLAAIGSEEAVAGLADCMRSEDAGLRNAAIDVLRGLPAQVAPVLAHLIVDPDRDVRVLAVGILEALRHPQVEEWLLHLIEADSDMNVCGAALDVLADIATPVAAGPVERLLARFEDEPYIWFAGRFVLSRIAQG